MARRTFYLPGMIAAVVAVACTVALLAISQKAEAAFPGKNGRIAYQGSDQGSYYVIYTIHPNGGGKTKVTEGSDPSFSADGKKIAYVSDDGNDSEIYTIKATGGKPFQVTDNDTNDSDPSYSPSGKRIAYVSFARAGSNIYTIKVGGGGKSLVARDGGVPSYSPDGNRIAYQGFEGRIGIEQDEDASANIYTIKADGGGNVNLTKSPKNDSIWNDWPSYSPDGEKIAYMGPDGEIYTIKVGGGGKSRVTNDDAYPYGLSWGSEASP